MNPNLSTHLDGVQPDACHAEAADDQATTRPLNRWQVGDVVALATGRRLVVLDPVVRVTGDPFELLDDPAIEVCDGSALSIEPPTTQAAPITDPRERTELLVATAIVLSRRHTQDLQAHRDLLAGHRDELDDIRRYAIRRHQDGDICRDGLNDFLTHFGLGAYQPRVRVSFTVTGSYEVEDENGDVDAAANDASSWLRVDLSQIDGVVADSESVDVTIDRVIDLNG